MRWLGYAHGGGTEGAAAAEWWLRGALLARFGVPDRALLGRSSKAGLALLTATVRALEGEGEVAFLVGERAVVSAVFERGWGVRLAGPPWRLDPTEPLPTYREWVARAEFGGDMVKGAGRGA